MKELRIIIGFLIGICSLLWLGKSLYNAWPPLLPIYLAILLSKIGVILIQWDEE